MPRITAAEAAALIRDEQKKLNSGRQLPPTLARMRTLMMEETYQICNVGPWEYRRELGSLGTFFVPAYDPALDTQKCGYSASAPIPCIFRHAYVASEDNYGYFEDDGRQVALEAIGVGFGLHPMNSLVQYGVFVPLKGDPTGEELRTARQALSAYYDRLIEEARDAYDKGPEERKAVISDRHLLAARIRGIDEKWVHHQHTQESVKCRACGRWNPPDVAKCPCGIILDAALWKEIMEQQESIMASVQRPAAAQQPMRK